MEHFEESRQYYLRNGFTQLFCSDGEHARVATLYKPTPNDSVRYVELWGYASSEYPDHKIIHIPLSDLRKMCSETSEL